jgi:hypothetical protein
MIIPIMIRHTIFMNGDSFPMERIGSAPASVSDEYAISKKDVRDLFISNSSWML